MKTTLLILAALVVFWLAIGVVIQMPRLWREWRLYSWRDIPIQFFIVGLIAVFWPLAVLNWLEERESQIESERAV